MSSPTDGIRDLFQSERGVFALVVLICATVLALCGLLDGATWIDFAKWLAITLIASKTVTTGVQIIADKGKPNA